MLNKKEKERINKIEETVSKVENNLNSVDDVGVQIINKAVNEKLAEQKEQLDKNYTNILLRNIVAMLDAHPETKEVIKNRLFSIKNEGYRAGSNTAHRIFATPICDEASKTSLEILFEEIP